MRWGVRDDAADDHITTALCMEEIENCKRTSVGLNFVVSWLSTVPVQSLGRLLLERCFTPTHGALACDELTACLGFAVSALRAPADTSEHRRRRVRTPPRSAHQGRQTARTARHVVQERHQRHPACLHPAEDQLHHTTVPLTGVGIIQYLSQVPVSHLSTSHRYQHHTSVPLKGASII